MVLQLSTGKSAAEPSPNGSAAKALAPPAVTIALPVRNEAPFVRQTVESLLAQTFHDFELLVSDNASGDGTADIIAEMAAEDSRIRLVRQPENIGFNKSMQFLIDNARSDYFLFTGGHDWWSPDALAFLTKALDEYPKAVLAFPSYTRIDVEGNPIPWRKPVADTTSLGDPVKRFNLYMWCSQWPLYGLARRSAWLATSIGRTRSLSPGAIVLGEMAVMGSFVQVPQAILYCRDNHGKQSLRTRLARRREECYARKSAPLLPHWRLPFSMLRSVWSVPLKGKRRFWARLLLSFSALTAIIRHRQAMGKELAQLFSRKNSA